MKVVHIFIRSCSSKSREAYSNISDSIEWPLYVETSEVVYNTGIINKYFHFSAVSLLDRFLQDHFFCGEFYQIGSGYVVAIRGTDDIGDYPIDALYGIGLQGITNQLVDTLALVEAAEVLAGQDGSIVLTGHSLERLVPVAEPGARTAENVTLTLSAVHQPKTTRNKADRLNADRVSAAFWEGAPS